MFNDYIKEKVSEKIDFDFHLFIEYINIYFNFMIKFYKNKENINQLSNFIKEYFKYSLIEYKIFQCIKKTNNINLEDDYSQILEELEERFINNFNNIETVLNGYEEAIFYNDITRCYFQNKKFATEDLLRQKELIKNKG